MQVRLPYGKTAITIDAPPERVIASRLRELKPACSGRQLVAEAMRHPVAGPRLCERENAMPSSSSAIIRGRSPAAISFR